MPDITRPRWGDPYYLHSISRRQDGPLLGNPCPTVLRQRGWPGKGLALGSHISFCARSGPRTWPSPCNSLEDGRVWGRSYVRICELVRYPRMLRLELSISLISKTTETQTGKNFFVSHSKTQADAALALLKFRKSLAWFAHAASVFSCHKVMGTNEITELI